MKFGSLGSGSEGNSLLVSTTSGTTRTTVMIDCGFGIREAERRLARLGVDPGELAAILVTHEHTDHVGGVFRLARRHRIPVWLSHGTYEAVSTQCDGVILHTCRDSDRIAIGDLELLPFTVPHDAREPVQYVASDGRAKLGVLTDAGQSTPHMIEVLGGCDALMLEFNHDAQMLADSSYPASLKRRIAGAWGHLSNDASAQILRALDQSRLKAVVGAHLSQKNNTPELAHAALCSALGASAPEVKVACQQQGVDWVAV